MSERLEELKRFVSLVPTDPFPLYGLALEYRSLGLNQDAAATFEELLTKHPSYVPQYLMYGKLLAGELGDTQKAKAVLQLGVQKAQQAGNRHALGELMSELEAL
jgi:tetratricopeptide (TPR) repeat protein